MLSGSGEEVQLELDTTFGVRIEYGGTGQSTRADLWCPCFDVTTFGIDMVFYDMVHCSNIRCSHQESGPTCDFSKTCNFSKLL